MSHPTFEDGDAHHLSAPYRQRCPQSSGGKTNGHSSTEGYGHCAQAAAPGSSEGLPVNDVGAAKNAAARKAYVRRFEGSPINTVFSPQEYGLPE